VAAKQAKQFDEAVPGGLNGVIITKMDGSGKGGGALSAVASSKASKIAFIAYGEKPEAFEPFDAKRFVARLCGFPDLESLLTKAKEATSEEDLQKALEEGRLDYDTFLSQLSAMKKMGPLKSVMQMVGVYDIPEEFLGKGEEKMGRFEAAVRSMTRSERKDPKLMKSRARQQRVARGAGLKEDDVRELVDNFERMQKMMKGMRGNRGLMKHLSKLMPGARL
jgi:signal recognition particle subunit SRP54